MAKNNSKRIRAHHLDHFEEDRPIKQRIKPKQKAKLKQINEDEDQCEPD